MSYRWPGTSLNSRTCSVVHATTLVTITGDISQDIGSTDPGALGWGFRAPDENVYGIDDNFDYNAVSNVTTFNLNRNYIGTTVASGGSFDMLPMQGLSAAAAIQLNRLLNVQQLRDTIGFEEINLYPKGFNPDGLAANFAVYGYPGWLTVKPLDPREPLNTANGSPMQFQVYGNPFGGQASIVTGGNTITRVTGNPFVVGGNWEGKLYFSYAGYPWKVKNVLDASHLTVQHVNGDEVTFDADLPTSDIWYYSVTNTKSIVNVSGTDITYVSGQPFLPLHTNIEINGTIIDPGTNFIGFDSQLHLESEHDLGVHTNATLVQELWLSPEIATLRIQSLNGTMSAGDEVSWTATVWPDRIIFRTEQAGQGKYIKNSWACGENPLSTPAYMWECLPNVTRGDPGLFLIGGQFSQHIIMVRQNYLAVNYMLVNGGEAGQPVVWQTVGTDTDVTQTWDNQGNGQVIWTSDNGANVRMVLDDSGLIIAADLVVGGAETVIGALTAVGGGSLTGSFTMSDLKATGASGQQFAPPAHGGMSTGRYYYGLSPMPPLAPFALTQNQATGCYILISERVTVVEIGIRVTTADTGKNVQLAIYKLTSGGIPGAAKAATASISVGTTGPKVATISALLETGLYVAFVNTDSAGVVQVEWMNDPEAIPASGTNTDNGWENVPIFSQTFGTWPSSPALSFVAKVSGAAAFCPKIWVRK